ncbi:MAG: pitrilysin family protein, partial [Verrucomicrobiota bacterium]
HEISFPEPKEAKLENGLRVIMVERPSLPLLAAHLLVRSGSEVDPENLAGAASMTGSLLTRGTGKRTAPEIARAIESLGGSIESGARWDSSGATVIVMSDKADAALEILSDVVLHPTFKPEEIDRLKNQTLDGLRVALQEPGSLARFVTARVVFGSSEYGHASSGTPETVQAIQRDDIEKLYKRYYTPNNAALILVGNVTVEQGRAYAEKYFGGWKNDQAAAVEKSSAVTPDTKPKNVVIDMAQAGQAAVTVGKPAITRNSPDYYTGLVTNAALGTGFVSRLNNEIRIKRGLSYGARSAIDARRGVGPFVASAQTKNESAAEVATLLQSELKRLVTEPVQGEELKSRQAVLTGGYARSLETNAGYVAQVAGLATHDLALDTLSKFIPSINAVKTEDVTAFATKYFGTPPSLIVVGKAAEFLEALKKNFADITVIGQSDLDLNRPDLKKAK